MKKKSKDNWFEKDIFILEREEGRLQLRKTDDPQLGPVYVDFLAATLEYRRKFGGGRSEAIAKAVGIKKGVTLNVVDVTAGLGRDAFILASLGCRVHMIERVEMIAALLEDGLERAAEDPQIGEWVRKRLSLSHQDSIKSFKTLPFVPDVIYLDPMFPPKTKSALSKKEMEVFKLLVGPDEDADELLDVALGHAKNRVVVKRPSHAGFLADRKPDTSIKTPKHRFDVYFPSK